MPTSSPPDTLVWRLMAKYFGSPPQPSTEPNVLRGIAASSGVVHGQAKVIRALSESIKLQKGDILVTEMTAPPWTPLFVTAAAVVTDTGGVLCHCAICAREYHIPAVVGTGIATSLIKDGQLLEVDGNAGVVHILSQQ